jgi:hypothetical protein
MDKTEASKNKIFEKLELINEQAEMLKLHQGDIPQLYIDLLKKNVLKLYESVHKLDHIKQINTEDTPEKKVNPVVIEKVEPKKTPEVAKISPTETIEIKEKPIIKEEFKAEPKVDIAPPQAIVEPKIVSEPERRIEAVSEQPIVSFSINKPEEKPISTKPHIHPGSDLFTEEVHSIADKFSAQQDPSLGEQMQQNQITNIKSAIGINEKFLFINELFAGNLQDYNQSIDQLNLAKNLSEATSVFNLFQEKFNWDDDNEAVEKLKLTMSRKYSLV